MQPDELRRSATEYARGEVARGLMTCGMIVSGTVEYLHGQGEAAELYALAWEIVPREFAAHLEAQAGWAARTDSDRLTDAFRALDVAGIVAREDFACCGSCGHSEIGDEVGKGQRARGYVFYHGQDAERAAQGGSLWLAYGAFGEEVGDAEVGGEIVAALRGEGLEVDWTGDAGQRIHVRLRWAKRRHGRMAAFAVGASSGRTVKMQFVPDRQLVFPPMSADALAALELPWLPEDTSVRVDDGERTVTIRREGHRLISDDGRTVGRFDGLRLLGADGDDDVPDEQGLIEVTYQGMPNGPRQSAGRPMSLPEILDVVRQLPTRTGSWLCAVHESGIVQMRWENGKLWLESPIEAESASIGKYAGLDEVERMLTILATEHRIALRELDGVTTEPW
ncbi:hypothetical protein GCM10010435_82100 [Winogradskya consettensis]|uniref:DUF6891 domain-containing protein n=1 Tax=Winogradskya consettensis TaxID=113560 RepID=A0A919VX69_9ACTN|nr:hypothetical protein [Actinoplanes consettensis]GIM79077.1 hypothetical protein Aco04nite_63680 [Actinoplanes consettensis]